MGEKEKQKDVGTVKRQNWRLEGVRSQGCHQGPWWNPDLGYHQWPHMGPWPCSSGPVTTKEQVDIPGLGCHGDTLMSKG